MTLLAYTTAISAALLTLLTLATEPNSLHQLAQLHAAHQSFTPLLALSCGLAFLANWTNFIISKRLGALTLQVLGNFKNVVAAVAAVAVFSNPVTRLGLLGYGMTTLGVFLYSNLVHKYPAAWVPAPVSAFLGTSFTYRPPTQGVQEGKGKEECSDDREPSGGSRTSSEGGLRPELANGHGRDVEYAGASRSKRAAVRVVEERAPLVT
ncbi:hypothetical protein Vretifemale_8550 [Volvox reticuliferus]|nr:hypothetical protein Vretifemale_8550 [Volvox reticuliferus]